jgi:hypothetical protein
VLLHEEGDRWNIPILAWSDVDTEIYISEEITLSGIFWDGPKFKAEGKFPTYIYTHYRTDRDCQVHRIPRGHEHDQQWLDACAELRYARRLVLVDTKQRTLTVLHCDLMLSDGRSHPDMVDSNRVAIPMDGNVNPPLARAAEKAAQMLTAELRRHPDIK